MAGFAILRHHKHDSMAKIASADDHNERRRETPNADPDRRGENERLLGSGDAQADVRDRIDAAGIKRKIRDNAIRAVEYMATTTADHFDPHDQDAIRAWALETVRWAQQRHGAENVVAAHLLCWLFISSVQRIKKYRCTDEINSQHRGRVVALAQRTPDREEDGTATWSLSTLERTMRREGLPRLRGTTIRRVLRAAGSSYQRTRTWCPTGTAVRQRKDGPVRVIDPGTEKKRGASSRRIG